MKTKEISFTLPVIIALYEFTFFEGNIKKRMLYLIPILLTILIIPLSLIGTDKPIGDTIGELREAAQETEEIPRWSYLFTQFRVIITYIRLLFLPINQNLDYDYPIFHSFFEPEVFLSFVFLLLIFAFAVYLLYSTRYALHPTRFPLPATRFLSFGIFWFFITLSVESSIIPIRDVIFEHRVYLPSIGLFFAIITSISLLADKLKSRWQKVNRAVVVTFAIVIAVLSITTYERNMIWQDEVRLWENAVKRSPKKARGHHGLGNAYKAKGLIDKAIEHFQIALRIKPNYMDVHNNLGNAYQAKGLLDRAIEHLQIALRLKPDSAEGYYNLGIVYKATGLPDKAIEHFQIALRLKPDYVDAHNNLGVVYRYKGLIDKAIEHYLLAIRLNQDSAEAHSNLGNAYRAKGLLDRAEEHLQIALRLKPNYADAYNNLGIVYSFKGLLDEAIKHFRTALRLSPNSADIHFNLGRAYFEKGFAEEARKEFNATLQINPAHAQARLFLNYIANQDKTHP